MSALAITSITNFILAGEVLFLAGILAGSPKARFSAAWYWNGVLLMLGLGALTGGVDHGFFESANRPRYLIQRADWILLGAMTFCLLMTTAKQFFSLRVQRIFLIAGIIQFVANVIVILLVDSFLVVTLNYAPVAILLLIMNFAGLRKGVGSWRINAGILVMFGASGIQAAGLDYLSPLDHNGLYHVASMVGVLFLYLGGKQLKS